MCNPRGGDELPLLDFCSMISTILPMCSWKTFLTLNIFLAASFWPATSYAASDACRRPLAKSIVQDPKNLQSHNGVLETTLVLLNLRGPKVQIAYCYMSPEGHQSPTLRVKPGDL